MAKPKNPPVVMSTMKWKEKRSSKEMISGSSPVTTIRGTNRIRALTLL